MAAFEVNVCLGERERKTAGLHDKRARYILPLQRKMGG